MTRNQKQLVKSKLIMITHYEHVKQKKGRFKTVKELCKIMGATRKTLLKWYNRYIESGRDPESLLNRSSAPYRTRRIPKQIERTIIALRDRLGWSTKRIQIQLARLGVVNPESGKPISEGCIVAVFERYGRGYKFDKKRLRAKAPPVMRYEKENPGELAHIDTKKLKNVAGCDPKKKKYEFALVDDCTRIAYVDILPDKRAVTAADFLKQGAAWFERTFGIAFQKLLSDNGKEYTFHTENGRKRHSFEVMCGKLSIEHKRTRVRRPQTNGKVERFFKTLDIELYKKMRFGSQKHRKLELVKYMRYYNYMRLHMGIAGLTPYEKLQKVLLKEKGGDVNMRA